MERAHQSPPCAARLLSCLFPLLVGSFWKGRPPTSVCTKAASATKCRVPCSVLRRGFPCPGVRPTCTAPVPQRWWLAGTTTRRLLVRYLLLVASYNLQARWNPSVDLPGGGGPVDVRGSWLGIHRTAGPQDHHSMAKHINPANMTRGRLQFIPSPSARAS
ncbi:hypothetical protein F4802DRAFT_577927 [Xylaria palmicola]|nr:hypothetical protein F4802DRAFT_577927 [Xylaria palmicola]